MHQYSSSKYMINRVIAKPKICTLYNLPQTFVCIDPHCISANLFCAKCAKFQHPHLNQVVSLDDFITKIESTAQRANLKCQEDMRQWNVDKIIKEKKQEIETLQLDLMEMVIKKLSEEKRRLFEVLESVERTYSEKALNLDKSRQAREEMVKYLTSLTTNKELAELKLQTSSGWGITKLKEQMAELDKFSTNPSKNDLTNLKQTVIRELSVSIDMQFFKAVKECLGQKPKSQPLLFVATPPPRRYSFKCQKSNETMSTRPSSSTELKNRSIERSRPFQARSNIML